MKITVRINPVFFTYILFVFIFYTDRILSQNKIQSISSNKWNVIQTEKIIINYPENYGFLAIKAISEANKTIDYYSKLLDHKLTHQIIIFIYPSFRDFQSSGIHPYFLPEGIAGFTEPYFERVVVPYMGNEIQFLHTLRHELVHSFQYDILLNISKERDLFLPLWFIEGMSEYLSTGIDSTMHEYLRDQVFSKKIPGPIELLYLNGYANYKIGQSIMYFIHQKWSIKHISILFRNFIMTKDIQTSFIKTFQIDYFNFVQLWQNFIYEMYNSEKPKDDEYNKRITYKYFDLLNNQIPFHYKPTISNDGKLIAYITYDKVYPTIVIQKFPDPFLTDDEVKKRNLMISYLENENFEEWMPLDTKLNFDKSNQFLYIPTRNKSKLSIVKFNISNKRIVDIYYLPFDSISDISINNTIESEFLIFLASLNGVNDIYLLDLKTKRLKKLTNTFDQKLSAVFDFEDKNILFIKSIHNKYYIQKLNLESLKEELIFSVDTEIKAIKEGYLRINNEISKGLYYNIFINNKFQLFFYDYKTKKQFQVTTNNRDVFNFDFSIKNPSSIKIIYTTLEDGTYEIFGLDFSENKEKFIKFYNKENIKYNFESYSLKSFDITNQNLTCCDYLKNESRIKFLESIKNEEINFYRDGFPFIALTGAVDSQGNSSLVFLGYGAIADLQRRHRIQGFLTYQEKPVIMNGELQYSYKQNRFLFNSGIYSYNGVFAILNPIDLSLNNIIYNPFQRLFSNSIHGIYLTNQYYFHQYSSFGIQFDLGREEQQYLPRLPEERPNEDIYKNHKNLRLFYAYDNAKYTIYGPLDGYSLLFGYEIPLKSSSYDKEVYQTLMEFRYYYLFRDFSLFAYRLFLGSQTGKDAKNFPYRIGGYSTIRGYEFQKFEGRYAFLMNLEYRFTFIEQLLFGFPFRWSPGLIRGSMFLDMGAAFDDPKIFHAFEGKKTKDLRASIGIGLHWNNFLWFIFPGAIMKIEWASPYDGKKSLPFNKWQGRFSLGFVF